MQRNARNDPVRHLLRQVFQRGLFGGNSRVFAAHHVDTGVRSGCRVDHDVAIGRVDQLVARAQDAACPLCGFRDEFLIPRHEGREQAYFAGNSLGLQPKGARAHVEEVLDKWAHEAVEGHFTGQAQWMPYHELVREPLAKTGKAEATPRLEFQGEFLHVFVDEERVSSDQPVRLTRGADVFTGDVFAYDDRSGVAELSGRVRGVLQPKKGAP